MPAYKIRHPALEVIEAAPVPAKQGLVVVIEDRGEEFGMVGRCLRRGLWHFMSCWAAGKLDVTLAALTHYERKAENPGAEFVSKVAKLFNVTADSS